MNNIANQDKMAAKKDSQPILWNVQYVLILITNLMINITGIILIALLPLFTISIGGNNSQAGLLTTVLTFSALICRPIFGKMVDVNGRRLVLILGLGLFAVSTLLLLVSSNIFLIFAVRFIQGIGLSAYTTSLGTVLSDNIPASRIAEGVGYFGISGTIAMAIGPTLGFYFQDKFGYGITYVISFGFGVLSIIFALLIHYEGKKKEEVSSPEKVITFQNRKGTSFIEKTAILPCLVMLFTVIAVSSVFSFMPLFGKARGIENIGLFFTVYAVSMILTRLFTGKAADRFGYMVVFLPAIVITFLLFITLAFAYTLPAVLLAAVFYGVGFGTVQPIMNTIVIKLSPLDRRGSANATYFATMDIGFGIGSLIWGVVSQMAGFTAVFLSCAVCIVVSGVLNYLLLHPMLKQKMV